MGASRRMRRDKALLVLNGVPMVVCVAGLAEPHVAFVTVVGPPERYALLGLRVVPDRWIGIGPLGGITTALTGFSADWNLILGCDLPYLTSKWLEWLIARMIESKAQAVVLESQRGLEPLAAMYRQNCGPAFATALKRCVRRISEAVEGNILRESHGRPMARAWLDRHSLSRQVYTGGFCRSPASTYRARMTD
jgi:molybdenum cofactor guanylyltransferase